MKTGRCRQDDRAFDAQALMAVLASQLDGRFIGLSTGVAEKNAIGAAVVDEPAGQLFLLWELIQVGNVLQSIQLILQRTTHHPVAVAQRASGDSCHRVQISMPLIVAKPTAASTDQSQWITVVGAHDCSGSTRT